MNNPLGVSPSKGKQGTTRGKEKNLLTSVGIEPTTSGLDLPSLCRLSYKVIQRKSGTIDRPRLSLSDLRGSWVVGSIPTEVKRFFSLSRVVPCFPLLGLTPSGLFMGLSSTIIYTSELILWFHYLCSQCYAAPHSYVLMIILIKTQVS